MPDGNHDPYVTKDDLTKSVEQAVNDYLKRCEEDGLMEGRKLTPKAQRTIRTYMLTILTVPSIIMALSLWAWDKGINASAVNQAIGGANEKIAEFLADAKNGMERAKKAQSKADDAARAADSVLTKAKAALSTADAAATKADTATTKADTAATKADTAATKANETSTKVDTAAAFVATSLAKMESSLKDLDAAAKKANDAVALFEKTKIALEGAPELAEKLKNVKEVADSVANSEIVRKTIENEIAKLSNSVIRSGDSIALGTKAANNQPGFITFLPPEGLGHGDGRLKLSGQAFNNEKFTITKQK